MSQLRPHLSTDTATDSASSPPAAYRASSTWTHLRLDLGDLISSAGSRASAPRTPAALAGRKRPPPATPAALEPAHSPSPSSPASEPLHKRRRIERAPHYPLAPFTAPRSTQLQAAGQPPSPLFFSRTHGTNLPPRFYARSTQAAARMLSRAQGEEGGVKTVTLARGSYSGLSPPGPNSSASARSSDRSSMARTTSPGARDRDDRDALRLLGSVGITELLEHDSRPTFIVDTGHPATLALEAPGLQVLFANLALRSSVALWDLVAGQAPQTDVEANIAHTTVPFRNWLLSVAGQGDAPGSSLSPVEYGGIVWSCSTLRKRLRVVSGAVPAQAADSITPASAPVHYAQFPMPSTSSSGAISAGRTRTSPFSVRQGEPQDYFGDSVVEEPSAASNTAVQKTLVHASIEDTRDTIGIFQAAPAPSANDDIGDPMDHDMGFFDWTRLPLSNTLPRHIQFARSVDWANTPLGPIEFWSNDLRAMCNLIMASPHPAAMYWGDDLVAIYNEAYIGLAGQKHPELMGQSYRVAWAEIWDDVKDVFANARTTGQATMKDDDCLFIQRNGFLEETYFSWSIIPMVGEDGTVMGLYNPAFEKTRRKIAERRMLTLREVGELTSVARDIKGFWEQVLLALAENEHDTPFVLLYSVSDDDKSDSSSLHSNSLIGSRQCYLEGSLGVPSGHPSGQEQIDLKEGTEGFGPVFREVMKTDKPVVVSIGCGDLPQEMMEGLEWRGFGDACREVVICPIHPTTGETILGFLVLGINPRRPYDDDYNLFVQLLSRQLATSLASVVLFEEEIRRGQKAAQLAAEDRINLSEQLAARTQEAIESETRFTRMAEYSPAGLFIADHRGRITYCNDTWYEISRVPKERDKTDQWIDYVKEEDQGLIKEQWKRLVDNAMAMNVEFRFKTPWEDRNRNKSDTWVLFSAFPEKDENGQLKSVFGSITNISPQKWAEGFQKRKMEEAVELKRQQENFIDITSHEMRNPLSAILQCADEISSTLTAFRASGSKVISETIVSDSIDAAQTIALCAQHQKRIVDDVLTLSKLDSAMLMVTPVDAQPLQVVQRALKMFAGEVQTAGIQMDFVLTESFKKLKVDWVKMDPSRVLQVLINLTTNAIKFTTTEERRTIKVVLSASRERPSTHKTPCVSYFPMRAKRMEQVQDSDWGDGEEIYLEFAVQDTGRGLSPEELKILFQRFQQASPRTHVQYGGSGLGLFISRELTELQGGEIGVSSELGKGSTFAFYVKGRRSNEPGEATEGATGLPLARKPSNPSSPRAASPAGGAKVVDPPRVKDFATVFEKGNVVEKVAPQRTDLNVLIVEDNLVNQKVLQRQLNNIGITTQVANHGGEALNVLKSSSYYHTASPFATHFNCVLMDKEMPHMDGLQCTSIIRQLERAGEFKRHVPIIAVTANARAEQIATLLEAGMDDVVSKPFRIAELIPKMQELAGRYGAVWVNLDGAGDTGSGAGAAAKAKVVDLKDPLSVIVTTPPRSKG